LWDAVKIKIINVSGKEEGVKEVKIDSISVGDLLKKLDIDVFGVMVTKNGNVVREHDILTDSDNILISGMGCC
jgi:sulfur carrier protein